MVYIKIYLIAVNFVAFVMYGLDKVRAIKGLWRVPERVLLKVSLLGGALGSLLGMLLFRHKIRKWKFILLISAMLILQIMFAILLVLLYKR